MGSRDKKQIHVMFLPYMAPGHMMPMVNIARHFAAANDDVKVTIITTTTNAILFQDTIDRDAKCGRRISLETLRFPYKEAGLPEGCENLTSAPTPESTKRLFHGINLLQPQIKELFQEHRPDCIASDYLFPWTVEVAMELGIPRIAFSGSGFFNLCVADSIDRYQPHNGVTSETEPFIVPGLPDEVKLTRSQLPDIVKSTTEFSALFETLKEAERKSFGVLMNSYYELEPDYADHFTRTTGIKAWHLGPASLLNRDAEDKMERGDQTSVCRHACLKGLDSERPNSVLYICFGSLTRFSTRQISEIAGALEGSGHSFIWVVGKVLNSNDEPDNNKDDKDEQQEWWVPEGFEDTIQKSGKGLIVKGWAPQVRILEHPAIGGFLTHCGWNSILEGLCAGVPLVTWPIFAEQFYNEKLITQVLKVGVPVGNETWKVWATEESPMISRHQIEKAVCKVMDYTKEAEEMRKGANKLAELARKAVEENGSSSNDMKALIKDIRMYKCEKRVEGATPSSGRLCCTDEH